MGRLDVFENAVRLGAFLLVLDQVAAAGAEDLADIFQRALDAQVEILLADDVLEQLVDDFLVLTFTR